MITMITLVCFSIGVIAFINLGCISAMTIISKGELHKTEEMEDGYRCGQPLAPAMAGDMLMAYSATWDGDKNTTRNLYQNAGAVFGFMLIDALSSRAIYKLFYEGEQPVPVKEEPSKPKIDTDGHK